MATREIEEWSTTDASNNFTPEEGGWPEGMMRSDVNNAARAGMGAARRWYDDAEWLNLTVFATLNKFSATRLDVNGQNDTQYFTSGRRVKITGGTPSPVYATVVDSDFPGANTEVELTEFIGHTEVPETPTLVELHITPSVSSSVFLDDIFLRVTTLTSDAIQAAVTTLEATGNGGIIILEPNATYICDTQIDIGHGAAEGKIKILGRGAILELDPGLSGLPLFEIEDLTGIQLEVNTILEDIIFDGNSAVFDSAHDGIPVVQIGINVSNVWIRNCGFNDTWAKGIQVEQNTHKVWITDCQFNGMGSSGINITDPANNVDQIFIRGCSFDNVNAQGGSSGTGIFIRSSGHISDCTFINFDHGSNEQIGIRCGVISTEITIVGCRFQGTGLNTRGIYLQGRDLSVSACVFDLTGAGTEGVQIERSGNVAPRNSVTGCKFIDCQHAIRLEASAEDCIINGNNFESCPFPITDAGKRNKIQSNAMTNGTDGITLSSTASDTTVFGNTIDTFTSDAIVVNSSTDVQVLDNLTLNITTAHLSDSGTRTGEVSALRGSFVEHNLGISTGALSLSTTEQLISDGAGSDLLETIAKFADGNRVWVVESCFISGEWEDDTNIDPVIISLWHGTNSGGTITNDFLICSGLITLMGSSTGVYVDAGDPWQISLPQDEFTPNSGDDVYVSIAMTTGVLGLEVLGAADARNTYFRVRPK